MIFRRLGLMFAVGIFVAISTAGILLAGCGGDASDQPGSQAIIESARGFLDACGESELDEVRSFFTQDYLEANGVPDPINKEDLLAAMGTLASYQFDPVTDVSVQGSRAIVTVSLDIADKGEKTETMILKPENGTWKIESFTAMDWSSKPPVTQPSGDVEAEEAIRDFVIACIDGETGYIFTHLSSDYKKKHHLEKAWTTAEFSGIFGTARSYNFNPQEIDLSGNRAGVDVSIEFGTRGNLESETARVEVVREGKWLIDIFPFFIY
ncbi:MAG: hypothetical protein A2Y75_09705 [Candidatus Solincola sediminis]|uniref:DUF4878 domain-containing protein n=1 Tax=Candidatus Solincola sediminis TaxID=1797199 RepID=A0A1F2WEX9_9ACTN|nr:MAG: hypothetical protein A2Y75_09705 [Candidatus Solincola sediminis]